jgi:hypothetical protein
METAPHFQTLSKTLYTGQIRPEDAKKKSKAWQNEFFSETLCKAA